MRRAAWIGAAFGCVAVSLLPGLVFAAEKKEVIAVESPGLPGAIVCPEPQALEFAIQRQRQRSGFGFSLPPSCMLFGAGTVMESEGLDWHGFPIVAITVATGRRITGTTAPFMVEQFVRKRPPTATRKAPPPSQPKQWTTALAAIGRKTRAGRCKTSGSLKWSCESCCEHTSNPNCHCPRTFGLPNPGGDRESEHRRL